METRHVVHHKGSPRRDFDIGDMLVGSIIAGIVGLFALSALLTFLFTYWVAITAIIAVGGSTVLVTKLKKNWIKTKFRSLNYDKKYEKIRNEVKTLERIKERKVTLSEADYNRAIEIATDRIKTAKKEERVEAISFAAFLDDRILEFSNAKDDILGKCHNKSPKKLEKAITKIDLAINAARDEKELVLQDHFDSFDV